MDPISNVDRLVLLLRQRLRERSLAASATPGATRRSAGEPGKAGMDNVRALAGVEDIGDRQLARALVQNILADQFGRSVINDAQFQQVVDRVTETIEGEPDASALLAGVVSDLRASAR